MSDSNEKRRSPRCPIDLFVEESLDGEVYLHPAVDVSVHGIYILSQDDRRAVDFTRSIDIAFALPTGHSVTTSGRIIEVHDHRGQRGIRVAFNDLSTEDTDAIRKFIDATLGAEAA